MMPPGFRPEHVTCRRCTVKIKMLDAYSVWDSARQRPQRYFCERCSEQELKRVNRWHRQLFWLIVFCCCALYRGIVKSKRKESTHDRA